eukprot:4506654-Prymnesium_polylepis.1
MARARFEKHLPFPPRAAFFGKRRASCAQRSRRDRGQVNRPRLAGAPPAALAHPLDPPPAGNRDQGWKRRQSGATFAHFVSRTRRRACERRGFDEDKEFVITENKQLALERQQSHLGMPAAVDYDVGEDEQDQPPTSELGGAAAPRHRSRGEIRTPSG